MEAGSQINPDERAPRLDTAIHRSPSDTRPTPRRTGFATSPPIETTFIVSGRIHKRAGPVSGGLPQLLQPDFSPPSNPSYPDVNSAACDAALNIPPLPKIPKIFSGTDYGNGIERAGMEAPPPYPSHLTSTPYAPSSHAQHHIPSHWDVHPPYMSWDTAAGESFLAPHL